MDLLVLLEFKNQEIPGMITSPTGIPNPNCWDQNIDCPN